MKINIHDPRLPALWTKARQRGLKIDEVSEGFYLVSSFSVRGLFHKVVIEGDEASCTCASTSACTHRALAAGEHSYLLWSEFFYAEKERETAKRLKAESKAWIKVFERRKKEAAALAA